MSEYTELGCMNIVSAAYKKCLTEPRTLDEVKTRINFVKTSDLFSAWAALSERDEDSLANFVIVRNHKYIKDGLHN